MATAKNFSDLTERELLALAISLEEEDERIYNEFAEGLRENFPDSAKMFNAMAAEENGHRHRLLDLYRARFGEHIPLIRRQDVKGFVERPAVWLARPLGLDKVRAQAELMEAETKRFYTRAALNGHLDPSAPRRSRGGGAPSRASGRGAGGQVRQRRRTRKRARGRTQAVRAAGRAAGACRADGRLGLDPGAAVRGRLRHAQLLGDVPGGDGRGDRRRHLDGIRGSAVGQRLAHRARQPVAARLRVRADDDARRVGHALPYLIPDFWTATGLAAAVVAIELAAIAWIRNHYMDTPLLSAVFQVVIGGVLVFLTGILIGSA